MVRGGCEWGYRKQVAWTSISGALHTVTAHHSIAAVLATHPAIRASGEGRILGLGGEKIFHEEEGQSESAMQTPVARPTSGPRVTNVI